VQRQSQEVGVFGGTEARLPEGGLVLGIGHEGEIAPAVTAIEAAVELDGAGIAPKLEVDLFG
jgi:hypothetical protein